MSTKDALNIMDSLNMFQRSDSFSIISDTMSDCNGNGLGSGLEIGTTTSGNLKGVILEGRQIVKNIFIATIKDGVIYFLTTMPAFQSSTTSKGNIGLAFIPVKVDRSMRVSDISDQNVFGKLYNTPGTMAQKFGIRNDGTSNNPIFNLGYAANDYIVNNNIFSLATQITSVVIANMQSQAIPMSIFRRNNPVHLVNFILASDFNLAPGDIYAGVKYNISFSGEAFNIPLFPPISSTLTNGIATKIDSLALRFPEDFTSSSGTNVYLINSSLYKTSNCSVVMTEDPRDVLNANLQGSLTDVVFTNAPDCTVGVNYVYCPSNVTCTGNCKSSCPLGTCEFDADASEFRCILDIIPVNPILTPISPISEGIMFWIILIFVFVIVFVIIAAIFYSMRDPEEKDSKKGKKEEKKTVTFEI